MFSFELMDASRCAAAFLRQDGSAARRFRRFPLQLREFAGQHYAQLGAHFIAQPRITLGFRRLPLQRIHLPRDFFENVVDAIQIQLGIFQPSFRQPLLGLELGDPGGLFDDGAPVRRRLLRICPMRPCSISA